MCSLATIAGALAGAGETLMRRLAPVAGCRRRILVDSAPLQVPVVIDERLYKLLFGGAKDARAVRTW
jgi:hypothetical protein